MRNAHAGARECALNLHQATGIDGDYRCRAGAHDGIDFDARHAARNLGELDRERSAETAAFLRRIHFAQFQTLHARKQAARASVNAELAQGVAAIVIGDHFFQPRADIVDAGHFQQKARKFKDLGLKRQRGGQILRVFVKNFLEVMSDHRRAGAGRHHHVIGIAKHVQKVPRHLPGFAAIAAVEGRLAAAGLRLGKLDAIAQPLQHLGHGHSHRGEQLVDDAGDEDRNAFAHRGKHGGKRRL